MTFSPYLHSKYCIAPRWHDISVEILVRISHLLYCIIFSPSFHKYIYPTFCQLHVLTQT